MKTEVKKAESASKTIQSKTQSANQASMDVILQRVSQAAGLEDDDELLQGKFETSSCTAPVQMSANRTGLPDGLKSGVESLSGRSMDSVRVHYNSPQPAQLHALAYTQGSDIHVGPGQEKHLPHESWHVVQQMQGRVAPTRQMRGVEINDSRSLEHEADVMGQRVMQAKSKEPAFADNRPKMARQRGIVSSGGAVQMRNVVAESIPDAHVDNVADFMTKTYEKKNYILGNGNFDALYNPSSKILDVTLPVSFGHSFSDKAKQNYFIKNVNDTWSNKFKITNNSTSIYNKIAPPLSNWQGHLNDVNVNVNAVDKTGAGGISFDLGYNDTNQDYVGHNKAQLSEQGYHDTVYANTKVNDTYKIGATTYNQHRYPQGYNVYGHEVGHMFGLGDEYQIGNGDYIIRDDIKAYSPVGSQVKTYQKVHNTTFTHSKVNYRIWQVLASRGDVIGAGKITIVVHGPAATVDYTCEKVPNDGNFILLNEDTHTRSDALPGTTAHHHDLTEKAFGTDYANINATMDDNRNEGSFWRKGSHVIMGSGAKVQKHHYVTFWDAMVQAIKAIAPDRKTAPNEQEDWKII